MVMFTKEHGLMIKPMVMVFTFMSTVQDMKDIGKMIYNMVKEKKLGLMVHFMKDNM